MAEELKCQNCGKGFVPTCHNADEVLEYIIDGDRLRDIITKVEVTSRTI